MLTQDAIVAHLDALAKPRGSLGRLETLAARLALTQGTLAPKTRPRKLLLFAGDHGVVEAGVGIWPSAVTGAMIDVIAAGRASCSALAAASGIPIELIDVGSLRRGRHPGGLRQVAQARREARRQRGSALTTDSTAPSSPSA